MIQSYLIHIPTLGYIDIRSVRMMSELRTTVMPGHDSNVPWRSTEFDFHLADIGHRSMCHYGHTPEDFARCDTVAMAHEILLNAFRQYCMIGATIP